MNEELKGFDLKIKKYDFKEKKDYIKSKNNNGEDIINEPDLKKKRHRK